MGGKKKKVKMVLKTPKGTRDYSPQQMAIREKVINIIVDTFKKYGAETIETPLFELKETLTNKYGEDSKLIYDLEDQGGELCSLRYDLTVPFARYLAMNRIENMKRYHIGRVYRRDNPAPTQGRWREFYQCDFDIAGNFFEPLLPDAEALAALSEVLKNLSIGNFEIKINHRKLLDGIFAICNVPDDMFRTICSSVDKLDKMTWEDVKKEMLTKGLDDETADKIWEFVQLNGKPKELLEQLKSRGACNGNAAAEAALKELETLFEYLEIFEVLDSFSFDLSLARGLDYYTGIIFEAVLIDNLGLKIGSIAGGGRYDHLVEQLGGQNVPCIGFSVGVERIFAILESLEKDKSKEDKTRSCATEVLVFSASDSKSGDLMRLRMKILTDLRKANIPAEMVFKKNPRADYQVKYADGRVIPFYVRVAQQDLETQTVSIKHVLTNVELKDIPIAEVSQTIRNWETLTNQ